MKRAIAMVMLAASMSAARADTFPAPSDMAGMKDVHIVVDSDGRKIGVIANGNACAPFESRAVWGEGPPTRLLGYHCYHNPNR